jgi:hypothetical protein
MLYAAIKALLSGAIIAIVSEVAKRYPGIGALILSLPLISILAFIWLWRDTRDQEGIATLAQSTFWFILPTLPMFLVLPALLRGGMGFWAALGLACLLTVLLYAAMTWALGRFGVSL